MDVPSPVILRYLTRRKAEVENCQADFHNKQYDSSMRMGHQLKGNGATFGFPDLSVLGQQLEEAAISESLLEMETTLGAISTWINQRLSSDSFL